MSKAFKNIVIGSLLAAATIGATAPAQARVSDGVAVLAGIAGLGVGAAIASDHPRHYYREEGYYAPPPPPPPPRPIYYAPPPPPPYGYGYGYAEHCRVFERWNPYIGAYEQIRRCR